MRRVLPLAVVMAALLACGTPSPDLFEVDRTGRDRNANVRVLVSDGGTVTCNDGEARALDSERLLAARRLSRDLGKQAALGIDLKPRKDSTLRYRVRLQDGTIAFSDTSAGRTPEMNRLVAFVTDVTERVCKLER